MVHARIMSLEFSERSLLTADDEVRLAFAIEAGILADEALNGNIRVPEGTETELELLAEQGRQAYEEFWMSNLRMVANLAFTWADRAGVSADELFQTGCVGLGDAIMRWDCRRGYRFVTMAWRIVEREISKAALRRCGAIEASDFRLRNAAELRRTREHLETMLGREVGVGELARHVGRDEQRVRDTVGLTPPGRLTAELLNFLPAEADEPIADDRSRDLRVWLEKLPQDECVVVHAVFGLNGPPVSRHRLAQKLGTSTSTVRRIELRALNRLRNYAEQNDMVAA